MNLAKKSQFHFSFFKVDSQNPKFNLEYLNPFKSRTHILKKKGLQTHHDLPELLLLLLVTLAEQGEGAGVLPSLVQPGHFARDEAQGGVI